MLINILLILLTNKCLPNEFEDDATSFLILIRYYNKKDLLLLVLVAILSDEDFEI